MKLKHVRLTPVSIPRRTGVINLHVLVRLETENGAVGWGEISDLSHVPMYQYDFVDLERTLENLLAGKDPHNLLRLEDEMAKSFPEEGYKYSRSGAVRQGIELALLDLIARVDGVPVYQLLGGQLRDRIKVCYPIFAMRSASEVADNLERVAQAYAEGFDLIRVYVGANEEADTQFLRQFAEQFGDRVAIKSLDFSNAIHWRQALAAAERYADIVDFMLVESVSQHFDNDGLVEFRRRSRWPVSEHVQHLFHGWQLLSQGCVDILNISPYLLGGLRPCLRLVSLAEAARASVLIGTTQELGVGTAAVAHLGAAARVLDYPSDNTGPHLYTHDVVRQQVRYEGGFMFVPDGPGLGVEVDESRLADLAEQASWSFSGKNVIGLRDRIPDPVQPGDTQ